MNDAKQCDPSRFTAALHAERHNRCDHPHGGPCSGSGRSAPRDMHERDVAPKENR